MVERNTLKKQHTLNPTTLSVTTADDKNEPDQNQKKQAFFFNQLMRSQTIFFCDKTT
ncbi:MAG: hypothetical protein JXR71_05470 [Bacteroidales bacterium]|nr:hypothetical protein [Bacteroidales bacterium]